MVRAHAENSPCRLIPAHRRSRQPLLAQNFDEFAEQGRCSCVRDSPMISLRSTCSPSMPRMAYPNWPLEEGDPF